MCFISVVRKNDKKQSTDNEEEKMGVSVCVFVCICVPSRFEVRRTAWLLQQKPAVIITARPCIAPISPDFIIIYQIPSIPSVSFLTLPSSIQPLPRYAG